MQDVAEVHGDVARLGVDGHDRRGRFVTRLERVRRSAVRARHEVELAGLGGRGVELDADRDARAQDRVAAEAAVAVPWEIGEPGGHVRVLDHDALTVEAVGLGHEPLAAERGEPAQPRVVSQAADDRRPLAHVDQPAAHLRAVALGRPPRTAVVGTSGRQPTLDLGAKRGHLLLGEHTADVDEAVGNERGADLVVGVARCERPPRIGPNGGGEIQDRPTVVERAQRGLPPLEPPEAAASHVRHARVEEPERGAQLVGEVGERLARELDERVGRDVARPDLDGLGAGHVGVGSAVVGDLEAERADAREVRRRECAIACGDPGRELLPMELVEVDARELECRHAGSLRVPPREPARCARSQTLPVRANATMSANTLSTLPE